MGRSTVIVGAQWGDEGKGKWVDALSETADLIARYQGGNNAGHTIYVDGQKRVLHLLPSGILNPQKKVAVTAGVVVNPPALWQEIMALSTLPGPDRLWLSNRAHVTTPWHLYCDAMAEENAHTPIGTTKRGIGPTYGAKIHRVGMRLETYIQPPRARAWMESMSSTSEDFCHFTQANPGLWMEFWDYAEKLAPYVCDVEARLRKLLKVPLGHILFEGAQGCLLDIDHGTYPFVTSSHTTAAGAATSAGIDPRQITSVYGVAKAYLTRVGEGPFPTELKDATGEWLRAQGHEYGATTKRPRRCGWFDAVAMAYVQDLNGFDGVYLNKIDILTGLKTLYIAVAYDHPSLGRLEHFPSDPEELWACKPVYKSFSGWDQQLPKTGTLQLLPYEARVYIDALCEYSKITLKALGCGPHREDVVVP